MKTYKTTLLIIGLIISLNTYSIDLDSLVNNILDESVDIECKHYGDESYLRIKHNAGYIFVQFDWFVPYVKKEYFWATITYKNGDSQPIGYSFGGSKYLSTKTYDRFHSIFEKYNPGHIYDKSKFDW